MGIQGPFTSMRRKPTAEQKAKKKARNRVYMREWRKTKKGRACESRRTPRKKTVKQSRSDCLKYRYGLTTDQWETLFDTQGRKCKICLTGDPSGHWHTDHCHTTDKVRGILCRGCNTGLGQFKENKAALMRAVDYLGDA
jgi:Recombination endonuclease VII